MGPTNITYRIGEHFSVTIPYDLDNGENGVWVKVFEGPDKLNVATYTMNSGHVYVTDNLIHILIPAVDVNLAAGIYTYEVYLCKRNWDVEVIQTGFLRVFGVPAVDGLSTRMEVVRYRIVPVPADPAFVHAGITLPAEGTLTVTEGIVQPDVPRTISVKGSAATVAGDVTIVGLNAVGEEISEEIALSGTDSVEGNFAFASVTSITVPALVAADDAITVGVGGKLGLPFVPVTTGYLLRALLNGTEDIATINIGSGPVEECNITPAGVLDGEKIFEVFILR